MNGIGSLLLAILVAGAGAAVALADEFTDALRDAFQLPASAQIVWPPRANLKAGSIIDPALRVVATANGSATSVPVDGSAVVGVPAERLTPPNGFWIWRSFLADPKRLIVTLKLSEQEVLIGYRPIQARHPLFEERTPRSRKDPLQLVPYYEAGSLALRSRSPRPGRWQKQTGLRCEGRS